MDKIEAELVIEWFLDLESRLRQFLKTVPINWNYNAVLPLLAGIIVDGAGLVDSIFRKEFNLSDYKIQRKNLRIAHFQDHYEQRYSLSSQNTLIYQYPPILLNPFREWVFPSGQPESTLEWWDAFNKLKHERIEHYARCTLSNAVLSLCALHQVLSAMPCFFKPLIAHDMIALGEYGIPYAIEYVEQGREGILLLSESSLFVTPWGKLRFPHDLSKAPSSLIETSKRLRRFLGR